MFQGCEVLRQRLLGSLNPSAACSRTLGGKCCTGCLLWAVLSLCTKALHLCTPLYHFIHQYVPHASYHLGNAFFSVAYFSDTSVKFVVRYQ